MPTVLTGTSTISTPGSYQLGANIAVSGSSNAIVIACDDVTLDLNGYSITSSGAANTTGRGISTSGVRNRISILGNGGHIAGFYAGIWLGNSDYTLLPQPGGPAGFHIEGVSVDRCWFRSIRTECRSATLINNRITNTGGCTFYSNAYCFGIETYGAGTKIVGNNVFNVVGVGTGEGVGIACSGWSDGSLIKGNLITNEQLLDTGDYAIWIGGASESLSSVFCNSNYMCNWQNGMASSSGNVVIYEDNSYINCTNERVVDVTTTLDAGSEAVI